MTRSTLWRALLCGGLLTFTLPAAQANIIYSTDFSHLNEWKLGGNGNQRVVTAPDGKGTAVRYELNRSDSLSYRSELIHISGRVPGEVRNAHLGKEYWYGFSIWLEDYAPDWDGEILFQWHCAPDRDASGNRIEPYRNPPLSLSVKEGRWRVVSRGDSRKITPWEKPISYDSRGEWDLGAYKSGEWVHWVFRVKWAYNPGEGILQVWKNGQRVIDYTGGTTFNDEVGPYIATGIYKYHWENEYTNTTRRVRYTGALNIADHRGSFDMVSTMPKSTPTPPPPEPDPDPVQEPPKAVNPHAPRRLRVQVEEVE